MRSQIGLGIGFGLLACMLWGLTYLLPVILPEVPSLQISLMRAIVMGCCACVLLFFHWRQCGAVNKSDWIFAAVLSLGGNLIQPWFLFASVDYGGVPLAATFFGLVPVCVAIFSNMRDKRKGRPYLPASNMVLPLAMILVGLLLSNWEGLVETFSGGGESSNFLVGCLFAAASTAIWTWYPIRNADWLLEHPDVSPTFFTEMQCAILLPIGLVLYIVFCLSGSATGGVFGSNPAVFLSALIFAGVFCSFGASALWNKMSQMIPTPMVGPMLVFETVFSVVFSCVYSLAFPKMTLAVGMCLLVAGVVFFLKTFESKKISQNGSHAGVPASAG